ncbi:MAG: molybdopterin molybdotransferase MoeA, partial [Thermoleophilia bacterium]|nr:molybdopterin molybdotransferase MoeA [Thermoleophilia bacterium]
MIGKLVSIEEARARVLAEAAPLPVEEQAIDECLGQALAEDVVAPHAVPPFDNSGMDGYAVKAADTVEASPESPAVLMVQETLAAGQVAQGVLEPGHAVKIMTGAPLPAGADAVVQVEATAEHEGQVQVFQPVRPGRNVRQAGEDVRAGDVVLRAGDVLGPAEIGVLASLGFPRAKVHRRPRVAVVSTGSELVEVDKPLGPGQIRNSNGHTLIALCRQLGAVVTGLGIVPDDYAATRKFLEEGLRYDV